MKTRIVALASGLLFAFGLSLAGMTRPEKVTAFLDVAGPWDPSLGAVMAGAIAVAAIAFRFHARRPGLVVAQGCQAPGRERPIDRRLLVGASLFGVGWGVSGLCPGPAVMSLASGQLGAVVFVAAMLVGMGLFSLFDHAMRTKRRVAAPSSSLANGLAPNIFLD